jgi:hypothetical protein
MCRCYSPDKALRSSRRSRWRIGIRLCLLATGPVSTPDDNQKGLMFYPLQARCDIPENFLGTYNLRKITSNPLQNNGHSSRYKRPRFHFLDRWGT